MTNFAYTTGNPNNLTAGASASMNDIQGPFTDLRTFLNGANLSDVNLQNAGTGLAKLTPLILYGTVNGGTGAISQAGSGGWTSARTSAGNYTLTFSPAFSAVPALVVSPVGVGTFSSTVGSLSTSSAAVATFSLAGAGTDMNLVAFIAIGVR